MRKPLFKQITNMIGLLIIAFLISPQQTQGQTYCKNKGVNSLTRKLWIERFDLGNVSNTSGNNNGYADFSALTVNAAQGSTVPFSVKTGKLLFSKLFYARIYIDYNFDGDFDDTGELVIEDTARTILSGNIAIPSANPLGTARVRVNVKRIGYASSCGSYSLGETEDYTLNIISGTCNADAGSLVATNTSVCAKVGSASLAATQNVNPTVPPGFQTIYVLTKGSGLVIEQVNATPSFVVTGGGLYTIHTLVYDPLTLNLGIVVPGVTTGFDVNALLIQGGGTICASLDVTGAPVIVNNPDAGTLTAVNSVICGNGGTLSATPNGNSIIPSGYQVLYVLTSGTGLVIEQVAATPTFTVTAEGLYTIHTLVYDSTLDLSIVVPGVTTGFDVNGLLVQGGGSVCAALDVAGAQFNVANPIAGTLTAVNPIVCSNGGNLAATPNGDMVVPAGYQFIYVLTSGTGLVIEQVSPTPNFFVTGSGLYTIHTLVYNSTLDLSIVVPGVTTGFDVNSLLVQGGGTICASLDVAGAQFNINNPDAGTLTAVNATACSNGGTLTAIPDGNINIPTGYQFLYVLTSGTGLVIEQVSPTPTFTVSGSGLYTIHTLVYDSTLDLSIVVPGVTTGFDVNSLLVQGGGSICASLDVSGAQFNVNNIDAGTLTAVNGAICGNSGTLTATPDGNINVPAGYQVLYVLTSGTGLVIEQVSPAPTFTVTSAGLYTIHTLVYDSTLDLSIVVPGVTTGFDVNSLLVQGGGSICAALDVAGAQFTISNPDAGTLTAVTSNVCGTGGILAATPNGDMNVPAGYQFIYVLTSGSGLVIEQVSPTPNFVVTGNGIYTIHTLVYNSTLDLSIVVPGVTTGFDVNSLLVQGGGTICASLDVNGAQFNVNNPDAGTLTAVPVAACYSGGSTVLNANPDGNIFVPTGYQALYVLTSGSGLVIEQVSATPSFTVANGGVYTIHTLVYDPTTLDLSIVVPGVTTGFDVNGLLVQGGGSICASLDVTGAPFLLASPSAGTIASDNFINCLSNGSTELTGISQNNAIIPSGYQVVYVLTRGLGLVIQQAGATPQFTVTQPGLYRIHTLVYDPATLDLSIVVPGTTTGFDVNGLLIQGGGTICASLDVQGAPFLVFGPFICNLFGIGNSTLQLPLSAADLNEDVIKLAENSNNPQLLLSTVYPNPATDEFTVQYINAENAINTIQLINTMGQIVKTERFEDMSGVVTRAINVSALESGNYVLQIQSNSGQITGRISIVR